jgi:uncharacterized membrane protein YoaK (UPF0700 family)
MVPLQLPPAISQLAAALLGGSRYAWIPYLLLWLSLITGGVVGAVCFSKFGLHSLWIAASWGFLLTMLTALLYDKAA